MASFFPEMMYATCVYTVCMRFFDDLTYANTGVTNKLTQLKESFGGERKIYTSVDEFMADRQMLIDLVVSRRQNLKVTKNERLAHLITDAFLAQYTTWRRCIAYCCYTSAPSQSGHPPSYRAARNQQHTAGCYIGRTRQRCFGSVMPPEVPIGENMTSSTKPEIHNILQCRHGKTELRL